MTKYAVIHLSHIVVHTNTHYIQIPTQELFERATAYAKSGDSPTDEYALEVSL